MKTVQNKLNRISVIGGGFAGLSAACVLAKQGQSVRVLEKNDAMGGRARVLRAGGFTFDMGPSWYWMPDVFESFFAKFGRHPADYYRLVQLDPGFQVIYGQGEVLSLPARLDDIYGVFEQIEKGSAAKLKQFLVEGAMKYRLSMSELIYKPSYSWSEFLNKEVMGNALKFHLTKPMSRYVRTFFKDERLIRLMEFPVLFLGAMAQHIPALYSIMNYAAFSMGTWYPMGGMCEITHAMQRLASELNVEVITGSEVQKIEVSAARAVSITTAAGSFPTDGVIASADYHHVESSLLEPEFRNYSEKYWSARTMAPSCLIFYLGISKRLKKLIHHNLFFDAGFDRHASDIYRDPQWPEDPLFYACCPSKTDPGVAPAGMENLFLLVPVAAGLPDNESTRDKYFGLLIRRLEAYCGEDIAAQVVFRKSYCINDFVNDYHAYKGNGYGLANTLMQTAVLKPSLRNRKIKNLYYAGQLTVPGPGVPPALISGQIAAAELIKYLNRER